MLVHHASSGIARPARVPIRLVLFRPEVTRGGLAIESFADSHFQFIVDSMQRMSSVDQPDSPESLERRACAQWTVPVLRYPADEAHATALALRDGGIGIVELTMTTPGVFDIARSLVERGVTVGIGTVTEPASVQQAAEAGASFVVSFCLPDGFLSAAREAELLAIPGVFTPQECYRAVQGGARWVKIFSVRSGGPDHLRDLAPVLPSLQFMVSGGIGVSQEQLRPWHEAGAGLVAVGPELGTVGTVGAAEVTARAVELTRVRDSLRTGTTAR